MLTLTGFLACTPAAKKPGPVRSGLEDYIRQARSATEENREDEGSLWIAQSSLMDGFRDVKARRPADIVTVQVVETTRATTEASTSTSKESTAESGANSLLGLEKKIAELSGLIDTSRSEEFSGQGSTTRQSALTASITARVVEVFPNGHLLLEGSRETVINGERQIVTIRGIARPEDVSPQNVILSTSVAELEVEVEGRGIVSEAQEPGALFRILSGFWPF